MKKIKYKPDECEHCGQTTTYLLGLDHGTAEIVKAIAIAIGKKGINIVHPRKELEGVSLSSNDVGNLSRARFHGLIVAVPGKKGNYLLSRKGAAFLRNEMVPRYAIVSKSEGHQIGYFKPEEYQTRLTQLIAESDRWEGINYDIVAGEVFQRNTPKVETVKMKPLFS